MVWWMQYQVFVPILALQFLNLFWYVLIWRIAYRYVSFCRVLSAPRLSVSYSAVFDITTDDERSDDEDEPGEDDDHEKED